MDIVLFIKVAILAYGAVFAFIFIKDCIKHKEDFTKTKLVPLAIIGFISDLLDTWSSEALPPARPDLNSANPVLTKTCQVH